jgi:hypothetical protein
VVGPGFTAPYFLGRALAQIWTDLRWRPPVNEQEELVLSDIANCFKSAYELDPSLDYPWAEWKQILELLGRKGQEAFIVNERAHETPSIGYRRTNVTVALPGGWLLRIPGSFTDFEVDEQGDLSSTDPPRKIWFTAYRIDGADSSTFEKRKREVQKNHSDQTVEREDYFAQATISERKKDSGEPYFVLNSSNMAIGTRCVCTFLFPTLDQKESVLEMWRSLQPPSHQGGA